jgi:hypothetical protein
VPATTHRDGLPRGGFSSPKNADLIEDLFPEKADARQGRDHGDGGDPDPDSEGPHDIVFEARNCVHIRVIR